MWRHTGVSKNNREQLAQPRLVTIGVKRNVRRQRDGRGGEKEARGDPLQRAFTCCIVLRIQLLGRREMERWPCASSAKAAAAPLRLDFSLLGA
ncbi:unnamed protein product [Heligmosomoides polygyrus]|uniref:Uncharacterized protein n=1 Tax=Heligmosomoides polygyrus TaxID=6339 RepID=A0A183FF68_HELPZ|nr:unnamed protein product [Heligmosomoides polygyrus]